jgi:hypothetical protein
VAVDRPSSVIDAARLIEDDRRAERQRPGLPPGFGDKPPDLGGWLYLGIFGGLILLVVIVGVAIWG